MKKTYIMPAAQIVVLGSMKIMATSPDVTFDEDLSTDAEDVDVKENKGTLTNIWDVEW